MPISRGDCMVWCVRVCGVGNEGGGSERVAHNSGVAANSKVWAEYRVGAICGGTCGRC